MLSHGMLLFANQTSMIPPEVITRLGVPYTFITGTSADANVYALHSTVLTS